MEHYMSFAGSAASFSKRRLAGYLLILLSIKLLICGCSEETDIPVANEPTQEWYWQESEPTLSPDGLFVYHIVTDTANPDKDGIYRARVSNPKREQVFLQQNLHSPTVSPSGDVVACLVSRRIHYYDVKSGEFSPSVVQKTFSSIVYINNSLILAARGTPGSGVDSIFIVNEAEGLATAVIQGYDPSYVAPNTFICLQNVLSLGYMVVRLDISASEGDSLLYIDGSAVDGIPRWPSIEFPSERMVFSSFTGDSFNLYSATSSPIGNNDKKSDPNLIGTSLSQKAYILDYNLIIYTGPDGRFYQCKFDGSSKFPFWATMEGK